MDESYAMTCENADCGWEGELGDTIVQPHDREHLVCPSCGEAVAFAEETQQTCEEELCP
jgi:Fe2+ or Zn2+ uptake regulation protein